MSRWSSIRLVACLPLVLAGCLLPQPDTPPIPPGKAGTSVVAPGHMGAAPLAPSPETQATSADATAAASPSPLPSADTEATATVSPAPSPSPSR